MLNGLDLFSGIGGLSIALSEWVKPIAYCEIDTYCQGVLLSRISEGRLPRPSTGIWDDIKTFDGSVFKKSIDIMYGGFPCQDISVAGRGKGLEGERSGLFFEIMRLAKEIKPPFIFLENVPAITSRGGLRVVREIAEMGYDCRWCVISAASVGAYHKRERWFLLAHSKHARPYGSEIDRSTTESVSDSQKGKNTAEQFEGVDFAGNVADSSSMRCDKRPSEAIYSQRETEQHEKFGNDSSKIFNYWKDIEPPVCGVADGIPHRVDRIKGLGNAVVPQQAKEAFKILMGLK